MCLKCCVPILSERGKNTKHISIHGYAELSHKNTQKKQLKAEHQSKFFKRSQFSLAIVHSDGIIGTDRSRRGA